MFEQLSEDMGQTKGVAGVKPLALSKGMPELWLPMSAISQGKRL